jgi:hypothetical protein
MNNNLDILIKKELSLSSNKNITFYDIYPDFNWISYKELNPFLYIIGLRTEKDYINNYLLEGRYKGRAYKIEQTNKKSFHVLLATIGKSSIFNILSMLKQQLSNIDYLTIIFDGIKKSKNIEKIKYFTKSFLCKVNIIIEEENLGYWGHSIRNKHNDLEGDFIYHVDDDDILYDNSFDIIRTHCIDTNIIYIFKIMLENKSIVWNNKAIQISKISTQSGVIPSTFNKNSFWKLEYGGDYYFYKELYEKYNMIFIDKLIYKKL